MRLSAPDLDKDVFFVLFCFLKGSHTRVTERAQEWVDMRKWAANEERLRDGAWLASKHEPWVN